MTMAEKSVLSPAVQESVLAPADHEYFIEHGYVVVHDVIPPELIARTVAMLESATYEGRPGDSNYKPVRDELLAECVTERLRRAVQEIGGDVPVTPFGELPMDRPRQHQPDQEWHHEGSHVDAADPCVHPDLFALGVFLALTKMPPHGGAFMVAPSSPRSFRKLGSRRGYESIWTAALDQLSGRMVEFLAEPGDAIIWQHLMGHAASVNTSNPQTRHVLDLRFGAELPADQGEKPFEEMSTLERANSLRYLASRFGNGFVLPDVSDDASTASALRAGFGAASPIIAQVAFRWEGATYIAHVIASEPDTVTLARTTDWINWEPVVTIASPVGAVRSLHFDARYGATLTVAGESSSAILNTEDIDSWRQVTKVQGLRLLRQRYVIQKNCAKGARGQVCFYIDPARANQVRWRSATKDENSDQGINLFAGVGCWPSDGVACALPGDAIIEDALITATRDTSRFALVADVAGSPVFEVSDLIDEFTGDVAPLRYDADTTPRQMRIYERARDVWLVTYLRRQADDVRVHWGVIDWTAEHPGVREVTTGSALRQGLGRVGLL